MTEREGQHDAQHDASNPKSERAPSAGVESAETVEVEALVDEPTENPNRQYFAPHEIPAAAAPDRPSDGPRVILNVPEHGGDTSESAVLQARERRRTPTLKVIRGALGAGSTKTNEVSEGRASTPSSPSGAADDAAAPRSARSSTPNERTSEPSARASEPDGRASEPYPRESDPAPPTTNTSSRWIGLALGAAALGGAGLWLTRGGSESATSSPSAAPASMAPTPNLSAAFTATSPTTRAANAPALAAAPPDAAEPRLASTTVPSAPTGAPTSLTASVSTANVGSPATAAPPPTSTTKPPVVAVTEPVPAKPATIASQPTSAPTSAKPTTTKPATKPVSKPTSDVPDGI